jgi:hypothetical protein
LILLAKVEDSWDRDLAPELSRQDPYDR